MRRRSPLNRRRLAVCTLLATAATATAVLALPAAASADSGDITIESVSAPAPPTNAGYMMVTTESGSAITSLSVTLFSGAQQVLAPVSDFDLVFQTGSEEVWELHTPIRQSQLAPGTYSAVVDATDSSGPETGLSGGDFAFQIQPTLTLSETPATIDYGHQTETFSGTATEVVPGVTASGGTTSRAYANQPVVIMGPTGQYSVNTGARGNFTLSLTAVPGTFYAEIGGSTTTAEADTSQEPVTVTAQPDPVALSTKFAKATIGYGQSATISGTATYSSGGSSEPLSGATVTVARTSPAGQTPITATTSASGQFTATIPAQHSTGDWTVSTASSSLLKAASTALTLTVRQKTGFRQATITLGAFRRLSVHACLVITSQGSPGPPADKAAVLQYAAKKGGPWRKLTVIHPVSGSSYCSGGASVWQATVKAPLPDAWYRLDFAGSAGLEPAATTEVNRWRDATRITDFAVTPHKVAAKGAITVSGRLWRHTRKWRPYPDHKVEIRFSYQGSWYQFQFEPTTGSKGDFSGRFTVYVTSTWIARYAGDKTHFGARTSGIKVTATTSGHGRLALLHQPGLRRIS